MIVGVRSLHHHQFLLHHIRWCGRSTTPQQPSEQCVLMPLLTHPTPDCFKPCLVGCKEGEATIVLLFLVLGRGYFRESQCNAKMRGAIEKTRRAV